MRVATNRAESLRQSRLAYSAKTDHAVRLKGWPSRGSTVDPLIERALKESAAAYNPIGAAFRTLRVLSRRGRVVIAAVPIGTPFHDVSGHIESTVGRSIAVGLQAIPLAAIVIARLPAGVVRLRTHVVGVRPVDVVASRIAALVRSARRFFPFRFRWKAVGLPGLRA